MKKLQLLFSNEIPMGKDTMRLEYSLTEKYLNSEGEPTPIYGIQIAKHFKQKVELDEVLGISESKETVISILKKLFQYEVTPISMVEIVDELVTQSV